MKEQQKMYRDNFGIHLCEDEVSSLEVIIQIKDGTGETQRDVMSETWEHLDQPGSVCAHL